MAHPSQNHQMRFIPFDEREDENDISALAFQLASASAGGQRHGHPGAVPQSSYPGHPHHRPPHPHDSHPAMLVATPGLASGYYHPPSLNSGLASAIVAAEFQRQREASSAAQFAASRMNGMQPYILGFSNYGHHAPLPPSSTIYHQQPPQPQPQRSELSGMGFMVGGVSPPSPQSSLSAVAHSALAAQSTSSSSANTTLSSAAAIATLPVLVAGAPEDRTAATASTSSNPSTPNLTSTNTKSNKADRSPRVSTTVGPKRPRKPTPEWFGASTPLGVDEDKYYLSELQCVLRSEFVEAFGTTKSDNVVFINGRNKTIVVGQVGIRCKHCASVSTNTHTNTQQHAALYPSCIGAIYNIVQQMYRLHFEQCQYIPEKLKARVANLKDSNTSNRGGRKQYWIDSAKRIGLIDTLFGIHFGRDPKEPLPPLGSGGGRAYPSSSATKTLGEEDNTRSISNQYDLIHESNDPQSVDGEIGTQNSSVPVDDVKLYPLVTPDEKHLVADYLFLALEQMQPCNLMDSDRVGCYKGRRTGFPGLACKHCVGQAGCGRYFPASEASLSQTTTSQTIINHVRNCRRCPLDVRKQLEMMRRVKHSPTSKKTDKPKHGGRKVFFRRLWCRIQRIPLPSADTTDRDDAQQDFPTISSTSSTKEEIECEFSEKKKRKIRADSCEKEKRKSAKRSLEHCKAGLARDDCLDDTIEHDNNYEGDVATFSSDHAVQTAPIKSNSKTRIAYEGRTPLARGDDSTWLSEAECFIRQEIVEVFTANDEDLKQNGNPEIGQVGVRCFYCAENKAPKDRDIGHARYPSVVAAMQQAVWDLQRSHIVDCCEIPDDVRMSLQSMKNHGAKHIGDTAQYWIDAAKELGLQDSHEGHGIYFSRNPLEDSPADEIDIEKNDNESSGLVLVPKEDRAKCTDHMLLLLKQFEPCQFNESDRKSSRNRDRTLGFPGLGCIHCKVKRYFPLTEKKLQDSLGLMTTHIENCFHAPLEVKASINYLQHRSLMQKSKLAGQWKFAFFKGVWNRLHQNYLGNDCSAGFDNEAATIAGDDSIKDLEGKGRSTLWRREKAALESKNQESAAAEEEEVDSIGDVCHDKLNRICDNSSSSNNNDDQELRHSLTEMRHLIKAAALWLSERDAENDARARCGGGRNKGIKKR